MSEKEPNITSNEALPDTQPCQTSARAILNAEHIIKMLQDDGRAAQDRTIRKLIEESIISDANRDRLVRKSV